MVKAVRGAVSLDENTETELQEKVSLLFREVLSKNSISTEGIISIIFSQTPDITFNPDKALRMNNEIRDIPLFCTQEAACEDFPQKMMLRVLITFNSGLPGAAQPVYMGQAAVLRKDLKDQ